MKKSIPLLIALLVFISCDNKNKSSADDITCQKRYSDIQSCSSGGFVPRSLTQNEFKHSDLDQMIPAADEIFYEKFFYFDPEFPVREHLCKENNQPAEIVFLDIERSNCDEGALGCGDETRSAYICGDFYVIQNFNLSEGPFYYGPYEME